MIKEVYGAVRKFFQEYTYTGIIINAIIILIGAFLLHFLINIWFTFHVRKISKIKKIQERRIKLTRMRFFKSVMFTVS